MYNIDITTLKRFYGMRVTLKDIAADVGVTVGTVSHVLNGHDDISEATKKRVLEAAGRLGYVSDGVAGSLRSGKTGTIAVIVPDISNFLISRQIKAIEAEAAKAGYTAVIFNTNEDCETEKQAIRTAYGKRVDGILICPVQSVTDNNVAFLERTGIPFVMFSRFFRDIDTDYVCSDDVKGGYIAAQYLIDRGCRSALFVGADGGLECSEDRYSGVRRAFLDAGLSEPVLTTADPKGTDGGKVADMYWRSRSEFDSMIIFSDIMAFDIEAAMLAKGYRAGDIPIISFDIAHAFMRLPFPHVSVGMVDESLAEKAFSILLRRINGDKSGHIHRLIDVEVIEFK